MILSDFTLIALCLLGSAFFEGMEVGVLSLNRMRLRHLAEQGDRAARILQNFLEQPDRLIGTTLVGSNVLIVMASVIAAGRGTQLGRWGEALAGLLMTILVLVFAQYIPKAWFQSRPLKRCRPFAVPLRWSALILRPVINLINWMTGWMIPPGSSTPGTNRALVSTKDEIDVLAQESAEHGSLSPRQRIMIRRVLELSSKKARDIMTPRDRMTTLPPHATISDMIAVLRQSAHPRLPVCETDGRTFLGTINFFDVMAECETIAGECIDRFVRPPLFIREDMPIMEIFTKLRASRQAMCLVINARSEVTGLITNQNVLQEIVGKI